MTSDQSSAREVDLRGMTNTELHRHYLKLARHEESRATARKKAIRAITARDLHTKFNAQPEFWRERDMIGELDFLTSKAASADPTWKTHVAMNQWYIAQATMYGTAATTDLLERLVKALEDRG